MASYVFKNFMLEIDKSSSTVTRNKLFPQETVHDFF